LAPKWDEESFTSHSLGFVFAAKEDLFSQSLTLSSNLPPRVDHYGIALSLAFPYVTVAADSGVGQLSKDDDTWVFDPVKQSLKVSLFSGKLSIDESYSYGIEEKESVAFQAGISGYGAKLAFSMERARGYDFTEVTPGNWQWQARDTPEFLPTSLNLSYSNTGIEIFAWKNRIKLLLGGETELKYDMILPTSSYFLFSPKITFDINEFLHISFSVTSLNRSIFRYFAGISGFPVQIPGETNLFIDLFNSFAFWNENLRKSSSFKLQTLALDVTHELHDWLFNLRLSVSPRSFTAADIATQASRYDLKFSLSVLWRPMQSIKASILDKNGAFVLNPDDASLQ
jgi:hypothetical protein